MIAISALPLSTLKMTSPYGQRGSSFHYGTDYSALHGQAIYAVQSGTVKRVETAEREYSENEKRPTSPSYEAFVASGWGRYIVIDHDGYNFCSLYAHLSTVDVRVGDKVTAGQKIGAADNTGHSFGNHLHIELLDFKYDKKIFGTPSIRHQYNVNPAHYLARVSKAEDGQSASEAYFGLNPYAGLNDGAQVDVIEGSQKPTGNKLFGRKYRIIVYDSNGNGIDVSDLHVQFECSKSCLKEIPQGTIKIYNLNAITEGRIVQNGVSATIEAGYDDSFAMIYEGKILFATRYKESAVDYVTELNMVDGSGDRLESESNIGDTRRRGLTRREVLGAIAADNNFPTILDEKNLDENYMNEKYIRGKVMFGSSYDNYYSIASSPKIITYIDDGKIITTSLNDYAQVSQDQILQLDYDSGLIDSINEITASEASVNIITFKALLNPKIKLCSFVRIKNEYIRELGFSYGEAGKTGVDFEEINPIKGTKSAWGVYKVVKVMYVGDTRGNDWYIECQAVAQSGSLISMAENANSSVLY